jgi:uncharacterized protein
MKKRYLRLVRSAFRTLRHRRLRHRAWWQAMTRPLFDRCLWLPCRTTVATGIAIGFFFSMMPIPFQMLPAAVIAMRFRGNIPFAMAACWISNPFTQLPIWLAQFRLGQWLRDTLDLPMPGFLTKVDYPMPGLGSLNAASFTLGFLVSGIILALCAYPLVHLFSAILPHHLPVRSRLKDAYLSSRLRKRRAATEPPP